MHHRPFHPYTLPRSRRTFLRYALAATIAPWLTPKLFAAIAKRTEPLTLLSATLPDPDGHHPALRLKGDWMLLGISDGTHTGIGEISHSGDDVACLRRSRELFHSHVAQSNFSPDLKQIQALETGAFASEPDFLTATAISGLNQALYELAARRAGIPVWRLFRPKGKPAQREIPCYLTLNRALRSRETSDYLRVVDAALALGIKAVKLAPFEAVTRTGDQPAQAEEGFARLEAVRAKFPRISLRVDCHERFAPSNAAKLMPRFAALRLDWLEEPIPTGPDLGLLRAASQIPFAVGELFFGEARFRELLESHWADVIMPDPKHVGGFGPLIAVCRMAEKHSGQVSPHNPSGPVATAAALHAAAVSPAVNIIELALTSDPARQPGHDFLKHGQLRIPESPGWGLPASITERLSPYE